MYLKKSFYPEYSGMISKICLKLFKYKFKANVLPQPIVDYSVLAVLMPLSDLYIGHADASIPKSNTGNMHT
jgi:hypothetical protein